MSFMGTIDSDFDGIAIGIQTPIHVTKQVEKPSLTLVELFGNFGGYLSIWGIFIFLFGSGRMDPFGFVSRFIFIKQDRAKLLKELKKMEDDKGALLSNSEKEVDSVTETSDLNNQAEFKNLLAKYYVETNFYEHAVKTPDV